MEPFTNDILEQRGKQYGDYREKCATVTFLLEILADAPSWQLLADDMKVSIFMIVMKLARIVHGNPKHKDSWADISGYAELISRRLTDTSQEATNDGVQEPTKQAETRISQAQSDSQGPSPIRVLPADYSEKEKGAYLKGWAERAGG